MSKLSRSMSLMLFHSPAGRNTASWRRPESRIEDLYTLDWAKYSAQRAEAALFDAIFLADKLFFEDAGRNPDMIGYEPLTTIGALSAVTHNIGMIATVSTTFSDPYTVARMFSQLDWLSQGRVGWNVVTSYNGGQNFQTPLPPKEQRYEQAEDFILACNAVWDAWAPDAVIVDREQGVWADPRKITQPNYVGKYYSVQDALSVPRSPQGRPVIAQAGQSEAGIALAARHAEVVFTAQSDLVAAQQFHQTLAHRAHGEGRTPIPVLPGLIPIVGNTEAEARRIADGLGELIQFDIGLESLSELLLGIQLDDLSPDQPIPVERLLPPEAALTSTLPSASRYTNLYQIVREQRPTLRQLVRERSKSHGHQLLIGTAETIADRMQQWFESSACDGFTITPPYMPDGLDRVCDLLVPELQQRNLFRTEYAETMLRERLQNPTRES